MNLDEQLDEIIRQLAREGRLIEGGWESYRLTAVPKGAPPVQVQETRTAFYAGALHLFTSLLLGVDPSEGPTEGDLKKMALINKELCAFGDELKARLAQRRAQQN